MKPLKTFFSILIILTLCIKSAAIAHEIRPASLKISQVAENTFDMTWRLPKRGVKVPKLSPNISDIDIGDPVSIDFLDDSVRYYYEIMGDLYNKNITIKGIDATLIDTLIQIEWLSGKYESFLMTAHNNSYLIKDSENSSASSVSLQYWILGIEHILLGLDHLLFVLCLLLLIKSMRQLMITILSFTIAHSLTLTLSSLGLFSLPIKPVEAVIALSIVYLALEVINKSKNEQESLTQKYTWFVAFIFGLIHGLGFASALSDIGLPESALFLALLFFNLGVETGQVIFVFLMIFFYNMVKRFISEKNHLLKASRNILTYCVGGMASFWLIERVLGF